MTEPKHWYDASSCGYDAPNDPFVETILEQNIKGERCAIGFYKRLLNVTQGKDHVTYNIILQILQDEVAHEEDLQALFEDLEMTLKHSKTILPQKLRDALPQRPQVVIGQGLR